MAKYTDHAFVTAGEGAEPRVSVHFGSLTKGEAEELFSLMSRADVQVHVNRIPVAFNGPGRGDAPDAAPHTGE